MKKTHFILIVSTLFVLIATAQKQNNEWTKLNLKGKVKSIREISYSGVEKYSDAQKGERIELNSRTHIFNNKGNQIEWNGYGLDGSLLKVTYKYDDRGSQIENTNIYVNAKPIREKTNTATYKYDDKGIVIEMNYFELYGKFIWKHSYKSDDKGNAIERNSYNSDGSLDDKTTYKYDDKGNQIESNWYRSDGGLIEKYTYAYDDKGNQTESNSYKSDGSLIEKYTYTYEYDKNLNWIKKIKLFNGLPKIITERVIEYF